MSVGVTQFKFEMEKEFARIESKDLMNLKQSIALQALAGVTLIMPVKSGRARGNTIVSVKSPDATFTDDTDKNGEATKAKGSATINADNDPYAVVYVQNNLPYIERLEGGHSSEQAPLGMFGVTFARLQVQLT